MSDVENEVVESVPEETAPEETAPEEAAEETAEEVVESAPEEAAEEVVEPAPEEAAEEVVESAPQEVPSTQEVVQNVQEILTTEPAVSSDSVSLEERVKVLEEKICYLHMKFNIR